MKMRLVTQEEPMGCGIACVAYVLGISYKSAKKLFDNIKYACTRGYYCRELVNVLNKKGKNYVFGKVNEKNKMEIKKTGTIVFIGRCGKYPSGHYLVRTNKGWMNPWSNYPEIAPAKSGFQRELPGKVQWVIYEKR